MAGISDAALGKLNSQNKFNGGTELEEDYGVNLYSTFYRRYDPQLGRFSGVDCKSETSIGMSVYQFGGNNPVSMNDPLGDQFQYMDSRGTKWHHADVLEGTALESQHYIEGYGIDGFGDEVGGGGGHYGGGASSATDIFGQLVSASKNGFADILDGNGNSVAGVKWSFSNGYVTSMMTLANDYNSINLYNQFGEFNISFNHSEFQNAGYDGPGDGPKISRSSFNFVLTGPNANTRNAKVWGIPAGLLTPEGLIQIIFGVNIYASIDVRNWGGVNRIKSLFNYFQLWNDDDIQSKEVNGKTHYIFSKYAQQVISADATDYASYWSSEKELPYTGSSAYKVQFKTYFLQWVNQYMPGTTMQILNTNVPGTNQAILIP